MKKHTLKTKALSLLLCLTTLFSLTSLFTVNASAAVGRMEYDCDRTVTFTVKTGSRAPSLKLVCDAARSTWGSRTHRCSSAPRMAIQVSPSVNGESFFLIKGNGQHISSTLRLKKNQTYTVRISYYVNDVNRCNSNDAIYCNCHSMGVGGLSIRYRGWGRTDDNYVNGSWYIAKLTNCTVSNVKVR